MRSNGEGYPLFRVAGLTLSLLSLRILPGSPAFATVRLLYGNLQESKVLV
jgi:hypothetical protein